MAYLIQEKDFLFSTFSSPLFFTFYSNKNHREIHSVCRNGRKNFKNDKQTNSKFYKEENSFLILKTIYFHFKKKNCR